MHNKHVCVIVSVYARAWKERDRKVEGDREKTKEREFKKRNLLSVLTGETKQYCNTFSS